MVSKRKLAIDCILQIAKDGYIHEFHEFQNEALKNGIIKNFDDKAVPNALLWLKQNNPDFIQVKKGEYLLRSAKLKNVNVEFSPEAFDDVVSRLLFYVEELGAFDWRKCSDAEFKEARRKLDVLKKVDETIKKIQ